MHKQWKRMLLWVMVIGAVLVVSACQTEKPAVESATAGTEQNTDTTNGQPPVGGASMPERTLDATEQLALGTLMLEETINAVTPEQANKLLPMWMLLDSGDLASDAETNAVLKQIQAAMTESQLTAIDAISQSDLESWYAERGVQMPAPGDTPEDAAPGGMFGDMTEEERAEMREQFQNMTDEEREEMMAGMDITPPEGGMPGGGRPGVMGTGNALVRPLVMLLQQRAAE